MSSTIHFTIPKSLLLPEQGEFRLELGYLPEYYTFLAKVICVLRDAFSEQSLYRGEPHEEYVITFLEDLLAVGGNAYALCNQYLGDILSCAMNLNTMLPQGVFERLDPNQLNLDSVSFIGVVHAVDYR